MTTPVYPTAVADLTAGRWEFVGGNRFRRRFGPGPATLVPQWPTAPADLVVVDTDTSGGARWGLPTVIGPTDVTAWQVTLWRVESGVRTLVQVDDLPAEARTWDAPPDLTPGSYEVEVLAVNDAGFGEPATGVLGIDADGGDLDPETLPPGPVRGLQASVPSAGTVRGDASPPTEAANRDDVTGYRGELLGPDGAVLSRQEPLSTPVVVFTGASAGDRLVRMTALSAVGDGEPVTSNTVTVGGAVGTAPGAVQNLARTLIEGVLEAAWDAPATGSTPTGFTVELLRNGAVLLTRTGVAAPPSAFTLTSDGSYQQRVTPQSTAGPGPSSTTVAVTYTAPSAGTITPPIPPQGRPARMGQLRLFELTAGTDNGPAVEAFTAQCAQDGVGARIEGSGLWSRAFMHPQLRSLRDNSEKIIIGETQGHWNRSGTLSNQTWAVTGGTTRGSNVLTVSNPAGLNVGDWVERQADRPFAHKAMNPSDTARITAIIGNSIEFDAPMPRTIEATYGGSSTNRRLRKWTVMAAPLEMDGTGRIRHRDWEGMNDGDNFVQQLQTVTLAGCLETYLGRAGEPFRVTEVGGSGIQIMSGVVGGEIVCDISYIPDLTRDPASIAHWGYGVSLMGGRDLTIRYSGRYVRHHYTTDWPHWTGQAHWEARGIHHLAGDPERGYGEAVGCQIIYEDASHSMSTGANSHENGARMHHRGLITDTGQWGPDAELKRDPTGFFIRSPEEVLDGMTFERIAMLTPTKWFAAVTTAEASPANSGGPWPVERSAQVRNTTVGLHNCKSAMLIKQPTVIGPNVDLYAPPGTTAITVQAGGAGSRIIGPVRVRGGGALVSGEQYLSGTQQIVRA